MFSTFLRTDVPWGQIPGTATCFTFSSRTYLFSVLSVQPISVVTNQLCVFYSSTRKLFSPDFTNVTFARELLGIFIFSLFLGFWKQSEYPPDKQWSCPSRQKKSTFQSCTAKIWKCISVYWYSWHEMAFFSWCNGTLFSSSRLFLFHVLRFHIRFYHQTKVVISQQVVRAGRDATACHIMNCVNDTICWHCCF